MDLKVRELRGISGWYQHRKMDEFKRWRRRYKRLQAQGVPMPALLSSPTGPLLFLSPPPQSCSFGN